MSRKGCAAAPAISMVELKPGAASRPFPTGPTPRQGRSYKGTRCGLLGDQPVHAQAAGGLRQLLGQPRQQRTNAIGAVVGSVVCRLHIPILPDEEGRLHVHLPDRTAQFADLERAVAYAEALGRQLALTQALRAGAESPQVTVSRQDDRAPIGQGGVDELWVRTTLEITATGRPRLGQPSAERASASSAQGETP
ncbi:MAG: hypothetical protein H5T66_09795 [Chloroflexi bacterium]|nr:hypothetical protein [Chloroflexota bacterium]